MKKVLILGSLLLIVFAVAFHQRIFVRDPFGKIERNGSKETDARLYINYSNDVLIEDASHRFLLVQSPAALPGVPQHLFCFTGLLCWTDADQASLFSIEGVGGKTPETMAGKEVNFVDESSAKVRVILY